MDFSLHFSSKIALPCSYIKCYYYDTSCIQTSLLENSKQKDKTDEYYSTNVTVARQSQINLPTKD